MFVRLKGSRYWVDRKEAKGVIVATAGKRYKVRVPGLGGPYQWTIALEARHRGLGEKTSGTANSLDDAMSKADKMLAKVIKKYKYDW